LKANRSNFFAVTAISNFCRYRRRAELYRQFAEMCEHAQVPLITVELTTHQRDFEVTKHDHHLHLQLRSHEEFWHKENLLNLGIAHGRKVFPNASKVAWIDSDCAPVRPPRDWFDETWHELEIYKFVQMWEWMQPLDYHYSPLCTPNPSFMANYIKYGTPYPKPVKGYPLQWGSPGLAWAANIDDLNHIGGLPDVHILGGADWWLSHMLISDLPLQGLAKYTKGFQNRFLQQQVLCDRWIKRDVGYVRGLVYHWYHGKTVNRGYDTREQVLIRNHYNPDTDLKRDHNGVYQMETWEPRQIRMYEQIRAYFRKRSEDSID
jgi:hypothetical protein